MSRVRILVGDALARLRELPDESVHSIVTSPPYFALRDYGEPGQVGLEATPALYVERLVAIFGEARRVLRADGTLWLNLGDSYAQGGRGTSGESGLGGGRASRPESLRALQAAGGRITGPGLKPKDLVGVPWRVALALQADGWWLRSDVVWAKPNPIPESVTDRPTKAHEYVFLLAKSSSYFYDPDGARNADCGRPSGNGFARPARLSVDGVHAGNAAEWRPGAGSNLRTVWTISSQPSGVEHFATMPPELAERCIMLGTSSAGACATCGSPLERQVERGEADLEAQRACGAKADGTYAGQATKGYAAAGVQDPSAVKARILAGMRERRTVGWRASCACPPAPARPCVVLDPFGGAATTALVAARLNRDALLIELNPMYAEIGRARVAEDLPLLTTVEVEPPHAPADAPAPAGQSGG